MRSTSPPYHVLARDVAKKSFAFDPQVHIATVQVAMTCGNKSGRNYDAMAFSLGEKVLYEDSKAYQRIMFVYSVCVDQHYQITRSTLDGNGVWQKALQREVEAF